MLVNLPANVVAAMGSSTNGIINTFISAELERYSPKGIITSAMVPAETMGIALTAQRVSASPLTMSATVVLTGVTDTVVKANAEAAITVALNAGLSPLRIWSSNGLRPDEVIAMFDATLQARILADDITITFNTQGVDPEIPFGSV